MYSAKTECIRRRAECIRRADRVYSAANRMYSATNRVYSAANRVYSATNRVYSATNRVYSAAERVYSATECIRQNDRVYSARPMQLRVVDGVRGAWVPDRSQHEGVRSCIWSQGTILGSNAVVAPPCRAPWSNQINASRRSCEKVKTKQTSKQTKTRLWVVALLGVVEGAT